MTAHSLRLFQRPNSCKRCPRAIDPVTVSHQKGGKGVSAMAVEIRLVRLSEIEPAEISAHMSDPRVAEHMPLLTFECDSAVASEFIAKKEAHWATDGLGHWAFVANGRYVGWGGFEKEEDEWDFGLVLKPAVFGLGLRIARKAIDFAVSDARIPFVTFLLPPSRKNLGALTRLGARPAGRISHSGATFLKYRLETV